MIEQKFDELIKLQQPVSTLSKYRLRFKTLNFFQTDRDLREMMNCVIVKMIIQFALRPSCYIVRLIESTNSENPPNYALVKMEGGKAR